MASMTAKSWTMPVSMPEATMPSRVLDAVEVRDGAIVGLSVGLLEGVGFEQRLAEEHVLHAEGPGELRRFVHLAVLADEVIDIAVGVVAFDAPFAAGADVERRDDVALPLGAPPAGDVFGLGHDAPHEGARGVEGASGNDDRLVSRGVDLQVGQRHLVLHQLVHVVG